MKSSKVYDIAGIGIGPFNLGLAALASAVGDLQCIFFDSRPAFHWHEGMLLDFSKLQVPFYADLVTGADPSNPYSFLSYLKRNNRLYQFAVLEENYISRIEYNAYCKWVAAQLGNLFFNYLVTSIIYDDVTAQYALEVDNNGCSHIFYAKNIVIGVGSVPHLPGSLNVAAFPDISHSSSYLMHKQNLLDKNNITVVGSGQSAAEIFYDLLLEKKGTTAKVSWITRSARFHPMESSKLTLEMTSPDYIKYFYSLSAPQKQATLSTQHFLYRGINTELITAIFRHLYDEMEHRHRFVLRTNCELKHIEKRDTTYSLQFFHLEKHQSFNHETDAVILATGYRPAPVPFLSGIRHRIRFNDDGSYDTHSNYAVDHMGNEIFIQNAELHSHGFNAPDLGMGPYRNAIILNTVLSYEYFQVEDRVAFQSFGLE